MKSYSSVEKGKSDSTKEDSDNSVGNEADRKWRQECVPEPENQIDLLVDDILSEDTESIVYLFSASSPNIGDATGCDRGEDGAHWVPDGQGRVHPVPVGDGVVVGHLHPVPLELVVQELVSQCKLDSKQEEV